MVGVMYNLPAIMRRFPGKYNIAVGWHGREYLYRHLVDEFWEIKEPYMWLREYCRAFHHDSKNLKLIEKTLEDKGQVISSGDIGKLAVMSQCKNCSYQYPNLNKQTKECPECHDTDIWDSFFSDVSGWKDKAVRVPRPSDEKMEQASKYLKPKSVGIFARGRKAYGRNLQPEFYVKLIKLVESMGYNPIWLGEKQTTLPCPVDHVVDFSRDNASRDLELTLAIIRQLEFTIQFWTASTRLAGIMGTPYLLFESPDQIWGNGQEGFRRNLCDLGSRKLSVNHYLNVYENNNAGIDVVRKCIEEMEGGNYEVSIGLVESEVAVQNMIKDNSERIGG
jgi:predicted Zn-ribbon and HTH transcriptional regulator